MGFDLVNSYLVFHVWKSKKLKLQTKISLSNKTSPGCGNRNRISAGVIRSVVDERRLKKPRPPPLTHVPLQHLSCATALATGLLMPSSLVFRSFHFFPVSNIPLQKPNGNFYETKCSKKGKRTRRRAWRGSGPRRCRGRRLYLHRRRSSNFQEASRKLTVQLKNLTPSHI